MVVAQTKRYTPAEYVEREEQAGTKSELIQGELIEIAGASANHNRITVNVYRLFPLDDGDRHYEIFTSDMRLWLPAYDSYTYPVLMF